MPGHGHRRLDYSPCGHARGRQLHVNVCRQRVRLVRRLDDPTHGVSEANDPKHIFKLRSSMNPIGALEIDGFFRYYGARPAPPVGDYGELDARIGYRIRPWWDVSLIGNNLLHERHVEFIAGTAPETYERSVRVRSIWRF